MPEINVTGRAAGGDNDCLVGSNGYGRLGTGDIACSVETLQGESFARGYSWSISCDNADNLSGWRGEDELRGRWRSCGNSSRIVHPSSCALTSSGLMRPQPLAPLMPSGPGPLVHEAWLLGNELPAAVAAGFVLWGKYDTVSFKEVPGGNAIVALKCVLPLYRYIYNRAYRSARRQTNL